MHCSHFCEKKMLDQNISIQFNHSADIWCLLGTEQFKLSEPYALLKLNFKLWFTTTGKPLTCECHGLEHWYLKKEKEKKRSNWRLVLPIFFGNTRRKTCLKVVMWYSTMLETFLRLFDVLWHNRSKQLYISGRLLPRAQVCKQIVPHSCTPLAADWTYDTWHNSLSLLCLGTRHLNITTGI